MLWAESVTTSGGIDAMPLLVQPASPSQRRPWLWLLLSVSGVLVALLIGLVVWSFSEPITLDVGDHEVGLGAGLRGSLALEWRRTDEVYRRLLAARAGGPTSVGEHRTGSWETKLPSALGGTEYFVWWY